MADFNLVDPQKMERLRALLGSYGMVPSQQDAMKALGERLLGSVSSAPEVAKQPPAGETLPSGDSVQVPATTPPAQAKVTADAVSQMNQVSTQRDPEAEYAAEIARAYAEKERLARPYMQAQEQGIAENAETIERLQNAPLRTDFSPIYRTLDTLYGKNLSKGYEKPEDAQGRLSKLAQLQSQLQAQRMGLTTEQMRLLDDRLKGRSSSEEARQLRFKEAQAYKMGKDVDRDLEVFSKRTEMVPSMQYSMSELDKLIPEKGDIPGVGVGKSRIPGFLLSPEGQSVRQHALSLINAQLKLQSGTAVTPTEAERKLKELGMGWDSTPEQFRKGYSNLKNQVIKEVKNKEKSIKPAALEEAKNRGIITSKDFVETKKSSQPDFDSMTDAELEEFLRK